MRTCTDCGGAIAKGKQRCTPCKRSRKRRYVVAKKPRCPGCGGKMRLGSVECVRCAKTPVLVLCPACGAQHWPWRDGGSHARKKCAACIGAGPERARARRQAYALRPKRVKLSEEERRARSRARAARKYAEHTAREKERVLAYKRRNPEKNQEWGHRRRAMLAKGQVQPVDIKRVKSTRKTCLYCGARLTPKTATIDHLTPIVLGGAHASFNLVVACFRCNSAKGGMPLADWVAALPMGRRVIVERLVKARRLNQFVLPLRAANPNYPHPKRVLLGTPPGG